MLQKGHVMRVLFFIQTMCIIIDNYGGQMTKKEIYILVGSGCLLVLCTAVVLGGGAYYLLPQLTGSIEPVEEIINAAPISLPGSEGLTMGDPDAKASIEVFEDFQCPACQYFSDSIEPVVIQYLVESAKAKYTFRHYPFIDGRGVNSEGESDQAANASMCANEQGKFWEMKAIIYANWNGENQGAFSDRRLEAMAESIQLDMSSFNTCFASNTYKDQIQADYDRGESIGVNGTPSVFVNGVQVGQPGRIATYEEIAEAVEAALAAAQ
jgi:protein-disulfide isomerase